MQVTPQQWARMTTQQRQEVVKRFDATPLHSTRPVKGSSSSVMVSRELSIRPETSGINSVPLAILKQIWEKATEYLNSSTDVISAPGPCRNAKMVASARPGIPPHYVHCLPSGQYLCDHTCLQWKSSSLCSHTVAVAGLNGDLESFVAWYVGTKQGTNLTALAVPPRPRSKSNVSRDVTTTTVLRPAVAPLTSNQPSGSRSTQLFQPSASDTSDHFDSSVSLEGSTDSAGNSGQVVSNTLSSSESQSTRIFTGTHSPAYSVAQTLAQPSVVSTSEPTLNSCMSTQGPTTISLTSTAVSGFLCSSPLVVQNPTINMYQPATPTSSSTNPFFLKFIQGNIRVCQGCRGSLRRLDGSIPQAPFDLAIARFERRPYRDKSGELRTPTREQASHYHLQPSCIQSVSPQLVLSVPSDVQPCLTSVHKEYLRLMFKLQL